MKLFRAAAAGSPCRSSRTLELARVLIVNDEVTSRLTLQTLLKAGGYAVDSAATAAEALVKLDERQYELVLSGLHMEFPEAGRDILAYARVKDYQPATALVKAYCDAEASTAKTVSIRTEDVPDFLGQVADLIGMRAVRRVFSSASLRLGG